MIRILIIDDHSIIREGLKRILGLEEDLEVVGTARDSEEGLRFLQENPVEIVLLDISMPGRSGLEIIQEIGILQPDARIIMLSMHMEEQLVLKALQSGARGYLTKENVSDELLKAIRKVHAGNIYTFPGFIGG